MANGIFCIFRITGTVGNKQSIEFDVVKVIIPWHTNHGCVAIQKTTDNVVFYAAVNKQYAVFSFSIRNYFSATYFCYLILIIGIYKLNIITIRENKFPSHRSFFTNQLCQLTGVYAKYSWYFILYQPFAQAFSCIPVTVFKRKIGNNQAGSLNFFRFIISRKSVLDGVVRDSVITN